MPITKMPFLGHPLLQMKSDQWCPENSFNTQPDVRTDVTIGVKKLAGPLKFSREQDVS
jgi:hypothetical protein